jgi:hypothetical protein
MLVWLGRDECFDHDIMDFLAPNYVTSNFSF